MAAPVKLASATAHRMAAATRKVERLSTGDGIAHYRRRFPRGGGGVDLVWGEVVDEVAARASWSTPGTGTVQLKRKASGGGYENDGDPVAVDNYWPLVFEVGATVKVDLDSNPPEIFEGTCPEA